MKFNEIFRKDVTYDNRKNTNNQCYILSPQKLGTEGGGGGGGGGGGVQFDPALVFSEIISPPLTIFLYLFFFHYTNCLVKRYRYLWHLLYF